MVEWHVEQHLPKNAWCRVDNTCRVFKSLPTVNINRNTFFLSKIVWDTQIKKKIRVLKIHNYTHTYISGQRQLRFGISISRHIGHNLERRRLYIYNLNLLMNERSYCKLSSMKIFFHEETLTCKMMLKSWLCIF
jgi:hypothetical protein